MGDDSEVIQPEVIVFTFGRMNPPTVGHEVLIREVVKLAEERKGKHEIVLSLSQDTKKNPLSSEDKLKHARRLFPGANITTECTIIDLLKRFYSEGYNHAIMVVGSDRVDQFAKLLPKYNGNDRYWCFTTVAVQSAGCRDPDEDGVEGMSASKMRQYASDNDFDKFKTGLPENLADVYAKELFDDVRKGLGIS